MNSKVRNFKLNDGHPDTEATTYMWTLCSCFIILQGQASPTTGKLFMLGDTNNNNLTRLEATSIEEGGPATFCFKPLDLKSSQYAAEGKKVRCYVKLFIFSHSLHGNKKG